MWTNTDKKFSTPPPTWRKQRPPPSPMSERKTKADLFHVIHKVPAGDSPYGRAKHIQLIDKDPSRAVSMFWAAINAGDRVDSALKDMAVVMKQLNRSDEAIEAIKSFRHLCPYDSQESLDNVLIELYKRSGRIEEEIEMLQCKLKNIEEGIAFGGAKTKLARSQGKKIQITIEQERSRILGNLAWAYLQQNNYEIAEQHYKKALSLEADKNKQCNLAICLMHMNRMTEAKCLLHSVKASAGNRHMDESYAKSFQRALQMLTELESPSVLEPSEQEADVSSSLADGHKEETVVFSEQDRAAYCRDHLKNKNRIFGYDKGSSKCISSGPAATSQFSPHTIFANGWRKGSSLERQCGGSGFASTIKGPWDSSPGTGVSCAQQEVYASPSVVRRNFEVPFTQPRGPSWGLSNGERRGERRGNGHVLSEQAALTDTSVLFTQPRVSSSYEFNMGDQRQRKWGEKAVSSSIRKLSFEQAINTKAVQEELQNVNGELLVSEIGPQKSENALPSSTSEDWSRRSLRDIAKVKDAAVIQPPSQLKSSCWENDGFVQTKDDTLDRSWTTSTWQNSDDRKMFAPKESYPSTTLPTGPTMVVENTAAQGKKSWADIVEEEEEEQESLSERIPRDGLEGWNMEEGKYNDENLNSNVSYPSSCHQIDYLSPKLGDSYSLENECDTSKNAAADLSKNKTARRSLCFGQYQRPNKRDINMKTRARLQVFRDITLFPDSP